MKLKLPSIALKLFLHEIVNKNSPLDLTLYGMLSKLQLYDYHFDLPLTSFTARSFLPMSRRDFLKICLSRFSCKKFSFRKIFSTSFPDINSAN